MAVRSAGRRSPLREVFDQASPANRLLVRGLAVLLVFVVAISLPAFLSWTPGADLEIPLRAADRWAGGGQPYLASAFTVLEGPDLPYLYPPWLLPILAPVAALPRPAVTAVWLTLGVAVAAWTCRRLSVPWLGVPFVLAWPPFAEGLVTGNVQVWQLAAFAALFYLPGVAWRPRPRELDPGIGADAEGGLLAAGVGAFKYTQLLPLVWLLRSRPRAAILGGVALVGVAVATLPFTGIDLYRDWLDQLGRAADPSWAPAGAPLGFLVGRPIALAATGAAVVAAFLIRGRDAGAWVGIALLVAAPSVHGYGMLFLLPALLTIRRDLALALAVVIARYSPYGWWLSVLVAALALAASRRFPALRAFGDEG
jgi:hypothetical protein